MFDFCTFFSKELFYCNKLDDLKKHMHFNSEVIKNYKQNAHKLKLLNWPGSPGVYWGVVGDSAPGSASGEEPQAGRRMKGFQLGHSGPRQEQPHSPPHPHLLLLLPGAKDRKEPRFSKLNPVGQSFAQQCFTMKQTDRRPLQHFHLGGRWGSARHWLEGRRRPPGLS